MGRREVTAPDPRNLPNGRTPVARFVQEIMGAIAPLAAEIASVPA
jgi:hypothetical protein